MLILLCIAHIYIGLSKRPGIDELTGATEKDEEKSFTAPHSWTTIDGGNALSDSIREEGRREGLGGIPGTSFSFPTWIFSVLLAIQCGSQPLLVKLFMPLQIVRSTSVLAQEGVKILISIAFLVLSGQWGESIDGWTLESAFLAAGLPAGLFVVQSYCNLMAAQYLSPVTFSVLNQGKILSTALFCFLLLGKLQSSLQLVALCMLVVAVLIVQKMIPLPNPCPDVDESKDKDHKEELEEMISDKELSNSEEATKPLLMETENDETQADVVEAKIGQLAKGVIPALVASSLSGLAGALVQKTLQFHQRSPHLFNIELGLFSSMYLVSSLVMGLPDCQKIEDGGVSQGWTWKTWVPVATNALGGILVGLVTKYQGAVVKGFCLIGGMVISGLLQNMFLAKDGGKVSIEQAVGGTLGALSLWLHFSQPPA